MCGVLAARLNGVLETSRTWRPAVGVAVFFTYRFHMGYFAQERQNWNDEPARWFVQQNGVEHKWRRIRF